ncbi:n-acetylated-alpha-linked acidic dipeptidase 2-like isoform x2 [Dermatophagoides farinae]|uniref:N-acetylated-alpha-linked acidic dipeptidase 2-like isoform x2 n=1 Tax=Dermatophagoides farinae TaxID=6954 RepID=A0A9D4P0N0_DERFA|nr:N-acetylated-alpha-linked acidic dipeptidase 2-like [Dermatophagoides farinae]XP_046912125.1 N-acetylated-alpha-linked acidic dipeptidase 2-like [Dermatophagoides farinae]XP_046912126.1 N-acetylated-alpha-linked acidic dipeptidase 2-like [Dermatophagoides farinae]XP_046912127.1 N-acetylated-alpha-linked acidic dipeptidase 2-like [Dermatophagoides farinae]KAH7641419.1 n-acetylated-alpha-linked acidic dipeptidase 2-like isoform x2 [Dermatophagoides farinae]
MAAVSPTLLAVLTIGVVALILGIFIGMYTIPPTMTPENAAIVNEYKRLIKNYYDGQNDDDPVYRALIQGPDPDSIRKNIQLLSIKPHQAGTKRDEELAQFYKNTFRDAGLDRFHLIPYKVLLSYTNPDRPNRIYLNDKSTNAVYVIDNQEPPLRPDESIIIPSYNGWSPSGDIIAEPVYCNYGLIDDFIQLDNFRIDVNGKICIIRYGRTFRGNKVANAERFGCAAVILFSDPESISSSNNNEPESLYPNSIWLNGKAMQSGSIRLNDGDPLTPGFPSIIDGFREDHNDNERVHLPGIPAQPIGYDDVQMIFSQMTGMSTEDDISFQNWTGKLNTTYRLGPGFQSPSLELRMVINNEMVEKIVHNVIGILDGDVEPDRFVIIGNHRDSWSYGALDASSGGASMLESAKIFGKYHRETGWRPRRSLIWASWAAEELGLIGSTEWTEQFAQLLEREVVAYINADICVDGPYLNADSSPSLASILIDSTKRIPAHKINNNDDDNESNQTLYDSWLANSNTDEVHVEILSSGSDHVPFAYGLGIPSINLHFKHDQKKYPVNGYPAYHTNYDTFYMVKTFIDPDFHIHQSCTRLINMLLYSLSCSTIIPVNFRHLSRQILDDYQRQSMDKRLRDILTVDGSQEQKSINFLRESMKIFDNATEQWQNQMKNFNFTDQPLAIRRMNDLIIMIERSFAQKLLPMDGNEELKNLLYGTFNKDFYQTLLFPGMNNLMAEINDQQLRKRQQTNRLTREELTRIDQQTNRLKQTLRRHLNDVSLALRNAAKLLRRNIMPII